MDNIIEKLDKIHFFDTKIIDKKTTESIKIFLWLYNPFYYTIPLKEIYNMLAKLDESCLIKPLTKTIYFKNLLYLLCYIFIDVETDEEATIKVNENLKALNSIVHDKKQELIISKDLISLIRKNINYLFNKTKEKMKEIKDTNEIDTLMLLASPISKKMEEHIKLVYDTLCHKQQLKELTEQTIKKKNIHIGYPEVHPLKGRPTLDLQECYYKDCHEKHSYGFFGGWSGWCRDLEYHLKASCPNFTQGFHKSHEMIINELKLTPDVVKAVKLRKCPSIICDKPQLFDTPEDLIYHFQELGLPPFWHVGWIKVEKKQDITSDAITKDTVKEINEHVNIVEEKDNNTCICCMEERRNIVCFPCNHQVMCWKCYHLLEKKQCILCRHEILYILPIVI